MPRKTQSSRTSLYRLLSVDDLPTSVQAKYLERTEFTAAEVTVGNRQGLLVTGTMTTPTVKWGSVLQELTGTAVNLGNSVSAGVLLIRADDGIVWALTYGMGFQVLDPEKIDGGFGQRVAVRVADPGALSSLTRTTLDQRARIDRSSIPSGEHLRGFGVGDVGELVTRLVGKANVNGLTGATGPITIRGADSLNLPLARTAEALVADLDLLEEILRRPAADGLEVLEQLTAVKKSSLIARLEQQLVDDVTRGEGRLGLSWPTERVDEHGTPEAHRFFNAGRKQTRPRDGVPTLEDITSVLSDAADDDTRVRLLRAAKIQLFSGAGAEEGEAVSSQIPLIRWLAYETDVDNARYCLHDGKWYLMGKDYAEKLRLRAEQILARQSDLAMPEWQQGEDEEDYNRRLSDAVGGTLLDQKLAVTALHLRGIELCDVLTQDGQLVHVKKLDRSTSASHLLAQALVSTDALLSDQEARDVLRRRVVERGGSGESVPDPIRTVVLGLARDKPLTAQNLFTFTQVTLVRNVTLLQARGVDVLIAPIVRRE